MHFLDALRVERLKRREISVEDPKKSTWAPGKSVRIIFPAEELRQKFLNLGAFTNFGNMSQFVNMFPLPITAQSVKTGWTFHAVS